MPEENGGAGAEENYDRDDGAGLEPGGGLGGEDLRFFGGVDVGICHKC